jgi:hypothetical protein
MDVAVSTSPDMGLIMYIGQSPMSIPCEEVSRKNSRWGLCSMGIAGIPFGSRVSPDTFYHPRRNLRKLINVDVFSGFVSMSDMFKDV